MINAVKQRLKTRLDGQQRSDLRKLLTRLLPPFLTGDLNLLAKITATDKGITHRYTQHYMTHFQRYRRRKIKMLEIGVGGYESPTEGGESLRMWKKYFPHGEIYAVDIHDKSALQESRIQIYKGSQVDRAFMEKVADDHGPFDIIIDDGSHVNGHVIETFKIMFPKLKDGGVYVIEDIQTAYWDDFGGDSKNLQKPGTSMNFAKSLTDCVNYQEIIGEDYEESYYDRHIVSVHFYHNLVFIHKDLNDEPSNIVHNHTKPVMRHD